MNPTCSPAHLFTCSRRFIAVEGGDGAGKSTQIGMLAAFFRSRGMKVTLCREPGSTPLGEDVREILLHREDMKICRWSELFLFMAARAQLTDEVIRPALERGEVVLTDRFLLSSVVYQGYGGSLPVDEIWRIGACATSGLLPGMTIVLDIPPEDAELRRQSAPDRMERQGDAFHQRVREGFLAEAQRFPEMIKIVAADRPAEVVHKEIRTILEEK